jgi:hypothetical protein
MEKSWSRVPGRDWEWHEGSSTHGVHTHEGKLVWWSRPDGYQGYMFEGAHEQSFDDFLASGPPAGTPSHVADEVRALLLEHRGFKWDSNP